MATGAEDIVLSYDLEADRVLIVGEPGPGRDAAVSAACAAGMVVRAPIDFAEAARDLTHFHGLRAIFAELPGAPEAWLAPVLARLDAIAAERRVALVATVAPDQIDQAFLHIGDRAQLLCTPTEAERVSAAALARWRRPPLLRDVTRETDTLGLQKLHQEVARIADALARMTERDDIPRLGSLRDEGHGYRGAADDAPEPDPNEIRRTIRARRMRAQFFEGELFADPAWDMLLDLFAAGLERRQVSVSSLCIAAAVPPTTALRWIGTLHEAGLFERHADPADRRRAYIALSSKGREGMRSFISAIRRAGLNLV